MADQDTDFAAARWVIDLEDGDFTQEQWNEFEQWLFERPQNADAYEAAILAWDRSAALGRLPEVLVPRREIAPTTSPRLRASSWAVCGALVLVVTAVIVSVYWSSQHVPPRRLEAHSLSHDSTEKTSPQPSFPTDGGGLRRINLEDGSHIELSYTTEVKVRFSPARRTVDLIRGQALFEVSHDEHRPFEVNFAGQSARALGTRFDIDLLANGDVEVMVGEGRVGLNCRSDSTEIGVQGGSRCEEELTANQSIVLGQDPSPILDLLPGEFESRVAWRRGRVEFYGQPLSQVVAQISRYTQRKITIADPSIASTPFGGYIQPADLDTFIIALKLMGIRAVPSKLDANEILLFGPDP